MVFPGRGVFFFTSLLVTVGGALVAPGSQAFSCPLTPVSSSSSSSSSSSLSTLLLPRFRKRSLSSRPSTHSCHNCTVHSLWGDVRRKAVNWELCHHAWPLTRFLFSHPASLAATQVGDGAGGWLHRSGQFSTDFAHTEDGNSDFIKSEPPIHFRYPSHSFKAQISPNLIHLFVDWSQTVLQKCINKYFCQKELRVLQSLWVKECTPADFSKFKYHLVQSYPNLNLEELSNQ